MLTPSEMSAIAERLYGCVVYTASPVVLREYWERGHPKPTQAALLAPAQQLVAIGWADASGAVVFVDWRWFEDHAEQAGYTTLALAEWLSIWPCGGEDIHLCALQGEDASVMLVRQRPRPCLLPFSPPRQPK